jgi:26S proteasome regulatory subunit T3
MIGQFNEMIDTHYGVVNSTAGSTYFVRVLSTLDREKLKPNTSIALHRHSHSVVDILPPERFVSLSSLLSLVSLLCPLFLFFLLFLFIVILRLN